MEKEKYHILAINYFNGTIDLLSEKELFLFVSQSIEQEQLFRKWENEWMKDNHNHPTILQGWEKMNERIDAELASRKRMNLLSPTIQKFILAASVALLVGLSSWFVYSNQLGQLNDERFELTTQLGDKSKLKLKDGTIVWLNAGSTLKSIHNNSDENRVSLEGEAYFEVSHQTKNKVFVVSTPNYDVVVKGTRFNVSNYLKDNTTSVTLIDGNVEVKYLKETVQMTPEHSFILDKVSKRYRYQQSNAQQASLWKENRIEYDEITLKDLINRLSRKYDVIIKTDGSLNEAETFHVNLRNEETIEQVLMALEKLLPIKYTQQDRIYKISKR